MAIALLPAKGRAHHPAPAVTLVAKVNTPHVESQPPSPLTEPGWRLGLPAQLVAQVATNITTEALLFKASHRGIPPNETRSTL